MSRAAMGGAIAGLTRSAPPRRGLDAAARGVLGDRLGHRSELVSIKGDGNRLREANERAFKRLA